MALILKTGNVYVGNACKSMYFSDNTGVYSATNLGGWGAPNILTSAITSTTIVITLPNGTTTVTITNPVGLPTSSTTFEYEITSLIINGGTSIPDGLYQIKYTVTDGIDIYTTGNQYFLFTCNIKCCVSKLFSKIAQSNDCSCDSTIIANASYANALYKGLVALGKCGTITEINSLITKLNTICNLTSGGCGC